MNARDALRNMTIQEAQDLGAQDFKGLLRLRHEAYAEHLGLMTVPEPLRKWAAMMTAMWQVNDAGMRLKVWHLVLPNAPSSWLIALLIVRYGEALRVTRDRLPVAHPEYGEDDGTLVDFWPLSFTPGDMQRAQDWMHGTKPVQVRYLTGMERDDAPPARALGSLSSVAPWLLAILGGLLSAWGVLADAPWALIGLAPLLGAALSDYTENQIVDHLFRTATWAKPTALWHALYTAAPGDAGGGTEVTGGSYARVNLPPLDTNWNATQGGTTGASSGTGGLTDNAVDITFPAPTANWGTIVSMGQLDASTGGNLFLHGALTASKTVNNGDPAPKFVAGALDVTFA